MRKSHQRKTYHIHTLRDNGAGNARTDRFDTKFRIDAAHTCLYSHVYYALSANGLLDTYTAHRCVERVNDLMRGIKPDGETYSIQIGNTSYSVQLCCCYTS